MIALLLAVTGALLLVLAAVATLRRGHGPEVHRSPTSAELADWLETLRQPIADGSDPFA